MTKLSEGLHAGAFLVSEANGTLSRDEVTIGASQTLVAGQVIGVGGSGHYIAYDNDASAAAAKGILLAPVTTGVGETAKAVIINFNAEVRAADLTWGATNDTGDKTAGIADLLALGIKLR